MPKYQFFTEQTFHAIDPSWLDFFQQQFDKSYFKQLDEFLFQLSKSQVILPEKENIFAAFKATSFENCKMVILGQDPYQNPGLAVGLSFSVPKNQKIPPSLRNIYQELAEDREISLRNPGDGDLTHWAGQGALMLNAALTVTQSQAGSHLKKGWLNFTLELLKYLNKYKKDLVFLSWGTFAHGLTQSIDKEKHLVLKTSHPSFFSKNKNGNNFVAFSGSRCFSKASQWLREKTGEDFQW